MNLEDIKLDADQALDREELVSRIRRAFLATRAAIADGFSRARVLRHNVPPTTPAHPAALPTADVTQLGRIFVLDKDGAADDEVYVCIRESGGAYAWREFTLL